MSGATDRLAPATSIASTGAPADTPDLPGPHWPVAAPRHGGPWTVRTIDGRWGSLDPSTGRVEIVEPVDDPALPALRAALDRGHLLGYRVGRRAVVRAPATYVKVVRPRRLERSVAPHRWFSTAAPAELTGPVVSAVDPSGSFELSTVAGDPLHSVLRRGDERTVLEAVDRIAGGLAGLHTLPVPDLLPDAGGDDPHRWVTTVGVVDPSWAERANEVAVGLPTLHPTSDRVVVHGDLHDKNVLITDSGAVGLIDLDGLSVGCAEDDVANLAVHLVLRSMQAGLPASVGQRRADRLRTAYERRRPLDARRFSAAEHLTWFRLGCLYRFRSGSRQLAPALLRRALGPR